MFCLKTCLQWGSNWAELRHKKKKVFAANHLKDTFPPKLVSGGNIEILALMPLEDWLSLWDGDFSVSALTTFKAG